MTWKVRFIQLATVAATLALLAFAIGADFVDGGW